MAEKSGTFNPLTVTLNPVMGFKVTTETAHRRQSRGGGQGDRSPTFRTGDNPPTFCCNIGKKYQNLLRIA